MDKPVSRQEFLHSLGRQGMLLGLAGVGYAAVDGTREVSDCFNHNYCTDCWEYGGCTLPEKKEVSHE
jgi:hypothetical protein